MPSNWDYEGNAKELVYDLRQGYAYILINILEDIEFNFQQRDYKAVFEAEDRLFMFISMKLKDTEKKEYNLMVKILNKYIDKNPEVYLNKEVEGRDIYTQLKKIMLWLISKMEEYKMFGSKKETEGLI